MITFEANILCDGCGAIISGDPMDTPQRAEEDAKVLATDEGWIFNGPDARCQNCKSKES